LNDLTEISVGSLLIKIQILQDGILFFDEDFQIVTLSVQTEETRLLYPTKLLSRI